MKPKYQLYLKNGAQGYLVSQGDDDDRQHVIVRAYTRAKNCYFQYKTTVLRRVIHNRQRGQLGICCRLQSRCKLRNLGFVVVCKAGANFATRDLLSFAMPVQTWQLGICCRLQSRCKLRNLGFVVVCKGGASAFGLLLLM
jgi:hypothetical protein